MLVINDERLMTWGTDGFPEKVFAELVFDSDGAAKESVAIVAGGYDDYCPTSMNRRRRYPMMSESGIWPLPTKSLRQYRCVVKIHTSIVRPSLSLITAAVKLNNNDKAPGHSDAAIA